MSGKWERRGHLWEGLGNPMLQICLPRIRAKDVILKTCFRDWKSVNHRIYGRRSKAAM